MSANRLNQETVEHVSKLARLRLSEQEIADFSQQLSAVLESFEKIAQVDTKDVQPLLTPTDLSMNLREDVSEKQVESDKFLQNAPERGALV